MIDLSEESLQENIEICSKYLERMSKIGMTLEIELGCTGGEEDGVDNSHMDASALYTQPRKTLITHTPSRRKISPRSPSLRPSVTYTVFTSRVTWF